MLAAIISTLIIYGCFEWSAQTDSRGPVLVVYSAIFLGFAALPLRHFPATAVVASLIWLAGTLTVVISRFTPGGLDVIAAAVAVVCGAVGLALWAITWVPPLVSYRSRGKDYRAIARMVAASWIVAAWSALAALLVHYDSYIPPGSEPGLVTVMLIIYGSCSSL